MNRLPKVLQQEIWEYVRGDRAYWKQRFCGCLIERRTLDDDPLWVLKSLRWRKKWKAHFHKSRAIELEKRLHMPPEAASLLSIITKGAWVGLACIVIGKILWRHSSALLTLNRLHRVRDLISSSAQLSRHGDR